MIAFADGPRSLADLGWPSLLRALEARAQTPLGRERASSLRFCANPESITLSLARIEEVRSLAREGHLLDLSGADDIEPLVSRAVKGGMLSAAELLACAGVMRAAGSARRFVRAHHELRHLPEVVQGLADLTPLASRIDATFEESGYMRDDASYELAEHRRRARGLHKELRARVDAMVKDPDFSEVLQDTYHSVRSERYVLPIKASFRARVPGIVHNASQSGQTIFVEPQELVPTGNELAIAEALSNEEEQRVLSELSSDVAERASELRVALRTLGALDLVQASARVGDALDAAPATLVEANERLDLRQVRHPLLLLQKKKVVPNTIVLEPDQRALVVSGPNAGGKTVTLSTVGLCSLMTWAGLPIPAAPGSSMPLFAGLAAAVGDAQDLARDLSTFTAHVEILGRVLERAQSGWLCLVDEIASGTDPAEGSALAGAVLETLVDQGARVVVTTHLDEVKALGVNDPRFVNARVGLNAKDLRPTFRLELGVAGASSALDVAAHAGLSAAVVNRARARLGDGGHLATALRNLSDEQAALASLQGEVAALKESLETERAAVAAAQKAMTEARRDAEQTVRQELADELGVLRERAASMVAKLQIRPTMREAQMVQRALEKDETEQTRRVETLQAQSRPGAMPDAPIGEGDAVEVTGLGQQGEVLSLDGTQATVAVGSMRLRASVSELVRVNARPAATRRPAPTPTVVKEAEGGEVRIDLRGQRGDDAQKQLEDFLDRTYLAGERQVVVVHGHGTGVLKRLLREALMRSPYVASLRPGERHEGGDGVTVVDLQAQ